MVGRTIGRYHITAPLGSGGMASVWKAEDRLLGRTVALKILDESLARDPQARRRFLREARTGATLDHPSIAAVYDAGESDGLVYFTLACVDGQTLTQHAARGPLPIADVVRIGIAAGEALEYAHAQGILHRDVTGRNVMITRDGRVVVLDFGLALARDQSRMTPKDTSVGTAGYMAPEVALQQPSDERSDVYGLGVALYEMATGTLPFPGDRAEAVIYATLHSELEPPSRRRSDLPPSLENIILRALEREPAQRYGSVSELVADLRGLGTAGATVAPAGVAAEGIDRLEPEPADPSQALPSPMYLAVLPFEVADAGETPIDEARRIALGLADAVSVELGQLESIHVIPPAGSRGGPPDDLRQLARHVGANLLLRGFVRFSRGVMRISISLYHPHRGLQIAARTIEGPRAELFLLENQVLTSVREFLGLGGRPGGRPRPDPAARERYLQALGYLQRYDHQASVDGAVRLLEGLTAGDPENASYHAALGRAYLERYRLTSEGVWESRAAESCQRAMALAPESPDVLISLGELHLLAGRREQAIREFQAVLRTRPESAAAYNDLARAFEAMGRRPEAEQACRQAIALQPEYWAHYNRLGLIFFNGGRYGESAEAWQLALRLSPDNAMVCRNLAGALFRQDRLEESADMYRRSIQIEPTSGAFSYLGAALYWLGRRDEAIDALRTSVAMAPRDWSGWGTLGNAYRWTPGHESLAAEALDRAIALMRQRLERTPGSAKEWANFASVLANRGLDGEAATAIERAIALPDFDLNCMAIAGSVCHVLGRREEALRWLRQAVGLGYGTSRLQYNPALEGLRNDPEFKRILAGARSTPAGATPGTPGNNGGAT